MLPADGCEKKTLVISTIVSLIVFLVLVQKVRNWGLMLCGDDDDGAFNSRHHGGGIEGTITDFS